MSTPELKSCPFCGGEAELIERPIFHYVHCASCGMSSDDRSRKDAIARWNRRATPPSPVPDGWVMVPKEPTLEMIVAHDELQNARGIPAFANSRDVWREMIAAAPAAPITKWEQQMRAAICRLSSAGEDLSGYVTEDGQHCIKKWSEAQEDALRIAFPNAPAAPTEARDE